jgi:alkylation response protein AidB-like acyl-CoA dehydrogenase
MKTLDAFRISVAAAAVGFARRALDESLDRVTKRKVFGLTLAELQLTQSKLAHMASLIDAAALLTYRAAWMKDCGKRTTKEAAMAKWFATEAAQRVVDEAVQLWGGLGVKRGYVVETLYRAVRPLRIYEGTSEIQQLIIAREILKAFLSSSDGRLSGQAEGREAERRKNDDGVHRP